MSTKQRLNIRFRINEQKQRNGVCPIYIRIYVDGKKAEVVTNHSVTKAQWDPKLMKVRSTVPNSKLINLYFGKVTNQIEEHFLNYAARGEKCTAKDLKNKLLGIEVNPNHKTIVEAFEYHNLKMAEKVKVGKVVKKTHTRYEITKNKVVAFMQHQYKIKDKPLQEIRLAFVTEFEHYLLTVDGLQSNTAHKYIKNLKKIMTMSVGLDWIPHNPFNSFKCSYSSPDREILTQQELDTIMTKKLFAPRLEEVRDVFIFCCYTGFAYSDIYKFERNAITIGIDGEYWLSTNRQKTGTKESVPLLPIPMEIAQRYQDHPYCVEYNKLLPVNSNQRFNSYLKEIADLCGIKKKITTHIARHTFATTVTLANGVPIETVSSMLGHSSIRTTQIYAKVVEHKVSSDMKDLREKLSGSSSELKKVSRT